MWHLNEAAEPTQAERILSAEPNVQKQLRRYY